MRFCISWVKPAITLLTTIIVATPSVTLMIEARAMYRVRRYRQQSKKFVHGIRPYRLAISPNSVSPLTLRVSGRR